jgi:membrane-associated phospholipid phosphatase
LMYKNTFAFWALVGTIINIIINMITKTQVKRIGEAIDHRIPFFGTMCRPIDTNCSRISEIGYGMPSGHSQIAGFIAAFYYFYYQDSPDYSKGLFGFYCAVALLIMVSRITAGMHSIPQVVFGCSIGILIAYGFAFVLKQFRVKSPSS